jgi:hypothetical protein
MTYVVILVLMLAAFSIVLWPLLSSVNRLRPETGGNSALDEMVSRRDSAYRALKELEFEYQLGNLSDSDYHDLRERYRAKAAVILQELEEAMAATGDGQAADGAADPDGSLPCPSCRKPTERSDEYCWSCGATLEGRCPSCARAVSRSDDFCAYCGTRLEVTA